MTPIPTGGQLVEGRRLRYAAEGNPRRDTLGVNVADGLRDHDLQYLVTLSSIEDDGCDEQILVVWEFCWTMGGPSMKATAEARSIAFRSHRRARKGRLRAGGVEPQWSGGAGTRCYG